MGEKLYHTLVNPNHMRHHRTGVQDNHFMQNPMGIAFPEEEMTVPLYMSGTVVCADISSPTQQQLEDSPRIVLTSPHEWDPHSIRFPKFLHIEEGGDLFAGIEAIHVDAVRIKVQETEVYPGICNTVHNPYFIVPRILSHVRIAEAKVPNATRITDIEEDIFEGRCQDVPSHRTFTSKERLLDVNPYDLSEIWQIGLGAVTKTLKVTTQRMLRLSIMPISR